MPSCAWALDVALIAAVFAWQIRRISVAELPEPRRSRRSGIVVVLFLVAYSGIYLGMARDPVDLQPDAWTRPWRSTSRSASSRPSASPTSRRAPMRRLVVSTQMLLDLAIIGAASG